MLGGTFRPWGLLGWVLDKLPVPSWSILGCHGTEERSTAVWETLSHSHKKDKGLFVRVDAVQSRFSAEATVALQGRMDTLRQLGLPSEGIRPLPLFSTEAEILKTVEDFLLISGPNVLLDISALPKRMFFPFIKRLLQSADVENLVVTYSIPASYADVLAEDHQTLQHLPLFGMNQFPEPTVKLAFVGVGFSSLGLPELLEPYKRDVNVQLLFPFPAASPAFQRNWSFVGELKKRLPPNVSEPIRVGAYDVPDVFEHISKLTEAGSKCAIFAPYGPKTMSLAMCLFAVQAGSVVYYTQPTVYNPAYSTGIKRLGQDPEAYAYCVRVGGRDLYKI